MIQAATELRILGKRRDHLEVVRDILMVALDGATTTRIVYRSNMTFPRFKKYSACLVAKGFLTVDGNPDLSHVERVYRTTEKGKRLLELLNEVSKLV